MKQLIADIEEIGRRSDLPLAPVCAVRLIIDGIEVFNIERLIIEDIYSSVSSRLCIFFNDQTSATMRVYIMEVSQEGAAEAIVYHCKRVLYEIGPDEAIE